MFVDSPDSPGGSPDTTGNRLGDDESLSADDDSLGASDSPGLRQDDVHRRMLELEQELIEFQELSKELEQALEDELRALEAEKAALAAQGEAKDAKIALLSRRVVELTAEVNALSLEQAEREKVHSRTVGELRQQLVRVEILNEDMMSQDRILENKLQLAQQFKNELLEKLAMVENDLELERRTNAQHRLTISNLEMALQPAKLTRSKRDSTYHDLSFANGTILDINEMLATAPDPPKARMPRLDSLTTFKELNAKSGLLRQKVGEMNTTLALKSPSTIGVSRQKAPGRPEERGLTYLPSMRNLSKLSTTSRERKELRRTETKKSKLRSAMQTLFA